MTSHHKKVFCVPAVKRPFTLPISRQAVTGHFKPVSARSRTVYVIGAPGPGEVSAKHPFQFIDAAVYRGVDSDTLCLVEQTGLRNARVELKSVETRLAPASIRWLTPQNGLVAALNRLSPGSICRLIVFSHGLPGLLTLRYGWTGHTDYGLKSSELAGLRKDLFTPEAELEFNSCNTGSYSDEGILAQNLATHVNRPVKAWTGRTSYREINNGNADGDASIKPSDTGRGGPRFLGGWDYTESMRRIIQGRGVPELVTFAPLDENQATFSLSASIPEGAHTLTAATGTSLEVTVERSRYVSTSFYNPTGVLYITPYRRDPALGDADESLGTKSFKVGIRQTHTWTGLTGGSYYLQITKDNGDAFLGYETLEGALKARIKRP